MKTKVGKLVLRATDGIIGSVSDFLLFEFFFLCCTPGMYTRYDGERAMREAEKLLDEVNYKTIKQAVYYLAHAKYIKRTSKTDITITEFGKKRIQAAFPVYYTKRPWDHVVYLVSYDIPTEANKSRNRLRAYLKRIGCGLLQESLWITPYDPSVILREFVALYGIEGRVIVSKLGKDGAIGDEEFSDLIHRVYHLEELIERYNGFLEEYEGSKQIINPLKMVLDYFAIVKDDPQLPFDLLPPNFPGEGANRLFVSLYPEGLLVSSVPRSL